MKIVITKTGEVRCLYSDEMADVLKEVGPSKIRRASHVEPTPEGEWGADLSPVGGPVLGPFGTRAEALSAEVEWLEANHL
jgi:hypothetical protein